MPARMKGRRVIVALAAGLLVQTAVSAEAQSLPAASPAAVPFDRTGEDTTGGSGPKVDAERTPDGQKGEVTTPGRERRPAAGPAKPTRPARCSYTKSANTPEAAVNDIWVWNFATGTRESAPAEGTPVQRYCEWLDTKEMYSSNEIAFPGYDALLGTVTPVEVAEAQLATFEQRLPLPGVRAWPALDRQVVGIETWFRVDTYTVADQPFAELGVTGNLHAEPHRIDLSVDGQIVDTCTTAGRVWEDHLNSDIDNTDCGHAFHRSHPAGTPLTISVTYAISWTASTGDGGPLGDITRTTVQPMHVRSYEALIR